MSFSSGSTSILPGSHIALKRFCAFVSLAVGAYLEVKPVTPTALLNPI